jgi:hypothetical protein
MPVRIAMVKRFVELRHFMMSPLLTHMIPRLLKEGSTRPSRMQGGRQGPVIAPENTLNGLEDPHKERLLLSRVRLAARQAATINRVAY